MKMIPPPFTILVVLVGKFNFNDLNDQRLDCTMFGVDAGIDQNLAGTINVGTCLLKC
jgi:hypothetical protein